MDIATKALKVVVVIEVVVVVEVVTKVEDTRRTGTPHVLIVALLILLEGDTNANSAVKVASITVYV